MLCGVVVVIIGEELGEENPVLGGNNCIASLLEFEHSPGDLEYVPLSQKLSTLPWKKHARRGPKSFFLLPGSRVSGLDPS